MATQKKAGPAGEKKKVPRKRAAPKAGKLADAVDAAIDRIRGDLEDKSAKAQITDLVRLLQLRKEMEDAEPPEITAHWVDECEDKSKDG